MRYGLMKTVDDVDFQMISDKIDVKDRMEDKPELADEARKASDRILEHHRNVTITTEALGKTTDSMKAWDDEAKSAKISLED